MACFGFGKSQAKGPIFPFTTFVLKVDATGAWESTVAKVLKKTKEVSNFRMYDDGNLQISGTITPVLLLKVLAKSGKEARLVSWQFGGCSRNLHMPEFEQCQQYKQRYRQHHQYRADMQAIYDDAYYRRGRGHGPGHHGYNYVDAYGRINGNAQYLPSGHHHHHPQTHYSYGYRRY